MEQYIKSLLQNPTLLDWSEALKIALEIVIIFYAALWVWKRIRGTQAERLVKGVLVLTIACISSALLGLSLITSILQQFIPIFVLALIVIFQPEIRRGLGYLGHTTFKIDLSLADSQQELNKVIINHIIAAVRELSRTKTGALIVIEPPEGERDYLSPGTPVNADISTSLLLSIFYPNSPLHDGAAVIRQNKIVAAAVILPMTDNPKLSYRYGTRHRAAIGLSEIYDGLCIVVSEETGAISAASRGMLVRYAEADDLRDPLAYVYHTDDQEKHNSLFSSFLALFSRSSRIKNQETNKKTAPAISDDDMPSKTTAQ